MRKKLCTVLPAGAVAAGLAGAGLRLWQLASALEPDTRLFRPWAPATVVLVLFCAAFAAGLLLLLLRLTEKGPDDFSAAFRAPAHTPALLLSVAAGLLCFAAAGLWAGETILQYRMWAGTIGGMRPAAFPAVSLALALLLPAAGAATLTLAREHYRPPLSARHRLLSLLPAFAALAWLIQTYQKSSREPALLQYAWSLLGVVCVVLALYRFCAFAHRRAKPRAAVFFALYGVFLNLVSLAGPPALADGLTRAAFSLLLLSGSFCLLRNWLGPVWPRRILPRGAAPTGDAPAPPANTQESGGIIHEQ